MHYYRKGGYLCNATVHLGSLFAFNFYAANVLHNICLGKAILSGRIALQLCLRTCSVLFCGTMYSAGYFRKGASRKFKCNKYVTSCIKILLNLKVHGGYIVIHILLIQRYTCLKSACVPRIRNVTR